MLDTPNIEAPSNDSEKLFHSAVNLVWEGMACSTSLIQRKLGIGYNRAARIVERMEQMGIVSQANHVGKRTVNPPDQIATTLELASDMREAGVENAGEVLQAIIKAMRDADAKTRTTPMKEDPDFRAQSDQAYGVAAGELKQFIERVERLEEEKKEISEQIKEVMAEAKGRGYDTKVMRKVISLRKRDADDIAEEEAVLEMYKAALGMA